MDDYINLIKAEFPEKVIDASESLHLLNETITSLIDDISSKVGEAISRRDFKSVERYTNLAETATNYERVISDYIDLLEIEDFEIKNIKNKITDHEGKNIVPNYEDYRVDNKVEHSLYENWMHKRPFGFRFVKDEMIDARSWNDVFLKVCEILYDIDHEKFLNFENISYLNGRRKKYFSKDPDILRKPVEVRKGIFVETNHSANTFRNIILRIIKEYKFKPSDFIVYFFADYTELNRP